MAYKPWEVQENLWKEKCNRGDKQSKAFLARQIAEHTGKSVADALRDLKLAEQSGMLHTDEDGMVEIE